MTSGRRISTTFDHGVGFSNGWAELALKKPPPFVPELLDGLLRGRRAAGEQLRAAADGADVVNPLTFWMTPAAMRDSIRGDDRRQGE